jgi:hypothetical protein
VEDIKLWLAVLVPGLVVCGKFPIFIAILRELVTNLII